jgi:hypothetical protein
LLGNTDLLFLINASPAFFQSATLSGPFTTGSAAKAMLVGVATNINDNEADISLFNLLFIIQSPIKLIITECLKRL